MAENSTSPKRDEESLLVNEEVNDDVDAQVTSEALVTLDDLNYYSDQKTYAKGFVDLALLAANANQILQFLTLEDANYRWFNVIILSLSIGLQVIAGILLILDHRIKVRTHSDMRKCTCYTTLISCIMLVIIVLNVFTVAFGSPGRLQQQQHRPHPSRDLPSYFYETNTSYYEQ